MRKRLLEDYNFYNKKYKHMFFNDPINNVKNASFRGLLEEASKFENYFGKDLSDFSLVEIEILMNEKKVSSVATKRNAIERYINYINTKKGHEKNQNPASKDYIKNKYQLKLVQDWEKQFEIEDPLLNYQDVQDIIVKVSERNPQDALIIEFLFEGLDSHEIDQLERKHIKDNMITINGRTIEANTELLNSAYNQTDYLPYGSDIFRQFSDSDHRIIKKVKTTSIDDGKTPYQYIQDRLRKIKRFFNIKKRFFKDIIRKAGAVYKAKSMYETDFKTLSILHQKERDKLAKQYGMTSASWINKLAKRENVRLTYPEIDNEKADEETIQTLEEHSSLLDAKDSYYKFWKIQEEYGEIGEDIVKKKLEDKGYKVIKQNHTRGYDFVAEKDDDELKIEVKTITRLNGTIFMSINEVEVSEALTDEYIVYIVHLTDKDNKLGNIYELRDPIRIFSMDIQKIYGTLNSSNEFGVSVSTHNISIKLTENFIENICVLVD